MNHSPKVEIPVEAETAAALSDARRRGLGQRPAKRLVSLRLDPDVLEWLRATGPGWQTRANEMLRRALG